MGLLIKLVTSISPIFLVASPVLSYSDQIWSIRKTRSSQGFSLDIPLIMLVASLLRIAYYPGVHYDTSLLIQSLLMVIMQLILLKSALDFRPPPPSLSHTPFADHHHHKIPTTSPSSLTIPRPFNFWRWPHQRPYWTFLSYLTISLLAGHYFISPLLPGTYFSTLGYLGLGIEATLPIPQVLSNYGAKSCRGFRFSVLANWLGGDLMKMIFFFFAESTITWAFKLCGLFQFACDLCLGYQYWLFGDGSDPILHANSPGLAGVDMAAAGSGVGVGAGPGGKEARFM
ncbi:MAG: hypothetical protein M1819_002945 [Sarea resinae]|nr:MAG: hypothetical protein M1819_002945 [Sarea resinae]